MSNPAFLAYGFAGLMAAISVYCIGRLVLAMPFGRRDRHDVNVSHALMGFAMAGMLVPRWNVLPNAIWELVFAAVAVYFAVLGIGFVKAYGIRGTDHEPRYHRSHLRTHLILGVAMLYMYWLGMPSPVQPGVRMTMSRPPGGPDPIVTLLVIVILLAAAVGQLDSVSRVSVPRRLTLATIGSGAGGGVSGSDAVLPEDDNTGWRTWPAPRIEVGRNVAMCLTMGYLLVLMV